MNGKPWLPQHDEILRRFYFCAYDYEIARMTGHSAATVQRHRAKAGLPSYHGTPVAYSTLEALSGPALLAIRAEAKRAMVKRGGRRDKCAT